MQASAYVSIGSKLSAVSEPLHIPLKSDTESHWLPAQEKAFQDSKTLLVFAPALKFLDVGKKKKD